MVIKEIPQVIIRVIIKSSEKIRKDSNNHQSNISWSGIIKKETTLKHNNKE